MSKSIHSNGRAAKRIQRKFRLARPGSVLILCVALLVLLALIGTAMISTTRVDRYSSVQHTSNTQVDLLMEGMKQVAVSAIVGDLWNSGTFNPGYRVPYNYSAAGANPSLKNYDLWDMPAVDGQLRNALNPPQLDSWL